MSVVNPTLIIGILNPYLLSNLSVLSPKEVIEIDDVTCDVIIHQSPDIQFNKKGYDTNFDILICPTVDGSATIPEFRVLPNERICLLDRVKKSEQRLRINAAIEKFNLEDFVTIGLAKTAGRNYQNKSSDFGNIFYPKMVLKKEHGARGIGQVLFEPEDVSPSNLLNELYPLYQKDPENFLSVVKEKWPSVKIGYDKNNGLEESLSEFNLMDLNDCFLEEYVDNVAEEYRLLYSFGKCAIFKRKREDCNGFAQACGSKGGMKKSDLTFIPEKILRNIAKILSEVGMFYGSADVFKTKDGKWGIFEYSPQYASEGVDMNECHAINRYFIRKLINDYVIAQR